MRDLKTTPDPSPEREGLFWIVAHEPGMVPERKGPWKHSETVRILREFIAARPTAYLHVLTIDSFGHPQIDHGPEVLQMLDGRSMGTGRKHNARTKAAHLASLSTPARPTREEDVEQLREALEHADKEVRRARREANDHLYMLAAYREMLGPKGQQVAKMWADQGMLRVHTSWGEKATEMLGEEIAQVHLDMEGAIANGKAIEIDDGDAMIAGNAALSALFDGASA